MEVQFALLADNAETNNEGRAHIFAAGQDTIFANSFPALHPQLALVVRFTFAYDEVNTTQRVTIEFVQPNGTNAIEPLNIDLQPKENPNDPGRAGPGMIALNLRPVTLQQAGTYEFRISTNGRVLKRVALYVRQLSGPGGPTDSLATGNVSLVA